jgi:GWxTD domain-containing protein
MKPRVRLAAALITLTLTAACAAARLERGLDPDSREFLSQVRYLITPQERRTFRNLPASERPAFIAAFWAKRDPDPASEENEFKTQYYQRIEEANFVFNEGRGSEPGWLQDRGRIYILLGPPDNREQYPRGVTFYGVPTEIWWYGWFSMLFTDPAWNGNYKLVPESAIELAEIMKTQLAWKPQVKAAPGVLEFRTDLKTEAQGKGVLRVLVPYRKIWFKEEDGKLTAGLTLAVAALDTKDATLWETSVTKTASFSPDELLKMSRGDLVLEAPLTLPAGAVVLEAVLTNAGDGARVSKRMPLKKK